MPQEDRRVHNRYRLWLPARIEQSSPDEPYLAVGHDMSQKGSLMVTNAEIPIGTHISVFLRIPPDADSERCIGAKVLRFGPNEADPEGLWPYQIAVEFDDADPELEDLLRAHTAVLEGLAES